MTHYMGIGLVAGFLTTIAFVPQAIKSFKTKNTEGISLLMYLCFVSGVVLWMLYGVLVKDIPILLCNIVTFIFSSPVLICIIINKKKGGKWRG